MTANHSTRKVKPARRFDTVDLGNHKTYTPIRAEDGTMEYELCYAGNEIGFATSAESARERLNEYAYDYERNRVEVADVEAVAVAALPEPELEAAVPFEPTPRAYGPQMDLGHMPQAPISTLTDGATLYGQYDTDDSHYTVYAETRAGWKVTADEQGRACLWRNDVGIDLEDLTLESFAALKAVVNSGAVEHALTCAKAWGTYQDVPSKQYLSDHDRTTLLRFIDAHLTEQPTPITIEQKVWPDIDEQVYTSTVYRYGQAEVLIHHDGVPGNLTAYDLVVNSHNMDARDVQGIRDAAVLLADARVQAALEVIGLPVPPTPPTPAAPAVRVSRWVSPESGKAHGTRIVCGEGDSQAEVYVEDTNPVPVLLAFGCDEVPLDAVDRVLPNVVALMGSAEVQQARAHAAQRTPKRMRKAA